MVRTWTGAGRSCEAGNRKSGARLEEAPPPRPRWKSGGVVLEEVTRLRGSNALGKGGRAMSGQGGRATDSEGDWVAVASRMENGTRWNGRREARTRMVG
jgi:hypothetical protein